MRIRRKRQTGPIQLYLGDNCEVLKRLYHRGETGVMLAYLDPPFTTGRRFFMPDGRLAYEDRHSHDWWIDELEEVVGWTRDMLDPQGCLVLHLDSRAAHYAKVMCDRLMGRSAFASEIVWRYRRWPSKTPNFQRMHDVLLRYRRNVRAVPRWNQLYDELAPSTLKQWGTTRQRAVAKDGKRVRSSRTDAPSPGVPLGDVWDIPIIAPSSPERTGYPTQKPRALLERLILALTDPGELVLDPYMGSGTTLEVARMHGRRAIGVDASLAAITCARRRLGVEE